MEIDQSASALVFLSYVLRDRKMAEVSNVIGGSKKSCYSFLKEQLKVYYEKNKEFYPKNIEALDFICENEKLHKYAIMCFCYNQQHIGRIEDFRNRWYTEKGSFPLVSQEKFLIKFAVDYPNFVDFVFHNAIKKLNILNKVMDLMARETSQNEIKTLNGEVIIWAFFKTKSKTRRYYDVVDNSYKSYRLKQTNNLDSICFVSMKRKFLSYLIHSIDSIIRKIIVVMQQNHGIYINHLHDCILIHPNYVDQ